MATNNFKDTIKAYLDKRAEEDSLFAVMYAKENKNIDECCAYITAQARKQAVSGCAVISDEEVFGWAVHYYDEDDIKVEKKSEPLSEVRTSISQTEVKKEAPRANTKPKKKEDVNQLSLF